MRYRDKDMKGLKDVSDQFIVQGNLMSEVC